ncbi:hypothetical protein Cpin_3138 [Chitinophaga pinensis DSM 2588]|uniref:Uncharacterized protein n=1 Tax=Chitinophaga pinensis (strain ATCC 43595 / DSM 2588 / LMG 13176 / NBRC 15968 / NCIMB 11800 / UQM 2034) TaxID=485918 RepID=A0A979GUU3_CHIPD|nr:hypothetical protein Cpin_3138 [Chitinophaga pinensis DSM 2588]
MDIQKGDKIHNHDQPAIGLTSQSFSTTIREVNGNINFTPPGICFHVWFRGFVISGKSLTYNLIIRSKINK